MTDLPSSRALPRGFRFASASCGLKKRGHTGSLDVALIVSDVPASAAAVFTQNLVQAPPVVLSRKHVQESSDSMRAVIVNSGNAMISEMIICSARPDQSLWADVIQCGAYDLITEPYADQEVNRIVQNALDSRYMRRFTKTPVSRPPAPTA